MRENHCCNRWIVHTSINYVTRLGEFMVIVVCRGQEEINTDDKVLEHYCEHSMHIYLHCSWCVETIIQKWLRAKQIGVNSIQYRQERGEEMHGEWHMAKGHWAWEPKPYVARHQVLRLHKECMCTFIQKIVGNNNLCLIDHKGEEDLWHAITFFACLKGLHNFLVSSLCMLQ